MERDVLHINGNEYELPDPSIELMKRHPSVVKLHLAEVALGLTDKTLEDRINEVLEEQ